MARSWGMPIFYLKSVLFKRHFFQAFSDFDHFIISSGSKRQFYKSKVSGEFVKSCRNASQNKIMKKSRTSK
jgi:hypothetical protein